MTNPLSTHPDQKSEILLYQTEDGQTKLDVRLENDTLWLTQSQMAELFQTTVQNITLHLKSIYDSLELDENSTCQEYLQVQFEGKREVSRNRKFYKALQDDADQQK